MSYKLHHRLRLILLVVWFAMFTGLWLYANTGFYGDSNTLNAGVYITIGNHYCGLETRGTFGFFCDIN